MRELKDDPECDYLQDDSVRGPPLPRASGPIHVHNDAGTLGFTITPEEIDDNLAFRAFAYRLRKLLVMSR